MLKIWNKKNSLEQKKDNQVENKTLVHFFGNI